MNITVSMEVYSRIEMNGVDFEKIGVLSLISLIDIVIGDVSVFPIKQTNQAGKKYLSY